MIDLPNLLPVCERLGLAMKEMTNQIRAIEKHLQALNLGVEVWVNSTKSDGAQFGFFRFSTGWSLAFRASEAKPPVTLLSAPRSARIESLSVMLSLLGAIQKRSNELSAEIEQTTKSCRIAVGFGGSSKT